MVKYTTIKESTVHKDDIGDFYPDIFTFPFLNIKITEKPQKYCLSVRDIYRFDLLIYEFYNNSDYDDLILWINNIEHIANVSPGTIIYFPAKKDLDNFYRDNYV